MASYLQKVMRKGKGLDRPWGFW